MALVCLLQKKLHRLELVKKNTKLQKNVSGVFCHQAASSVECAKIPWKWGREAL